ncbi:RND family transporter [Gemmatimonadota bacterium]
MRFPERDRLFDDLASFIVRRAGWILTITGLITLVSLLVLTRLEFNSDMISIMLNESSEARDFVTLRDRYQSVDPVTVLVSLPEGGSFREAASLTALLEYRDTISGLERVDGIFTFVPRQLPGMSYEVTAAMINRLPAMLRNRLYSSPVAEILLSEDGRHTLLIVLPDAGDTSGDIVEDLRAVDAPAGAEITLAGNPVIFSTLERIQIGFIRLIPPLILILTILIFFLVIGSLRLSLIAVLPAILASVWGFALLIVSGIDVTIYTVITPLFIMVLGSADGLHLVTHYQKDADQEASAVDRLSLALRRVGVPIILTTISTAIGFLALTTTGVIVPMELGGTTAAGILLAGLVSLLVLPALLSRMDIEPVRAWHGAFATTLSGLLITASRRRSIAIGFTLLIVITGVIAIPRLRVNAEPLYYFKQNSEIRSAFSRIDRIFGGATSLVGEFALDPDRPLEAQLEDMARLSREMEALPGIRLVLSLADLSEILGPEGLQAAVAGEDGLGLGRLTTRDGVRFSVFPGVFTSDDVDRWKSFAVEHGLIRILTGIPMIHDSQHHIVVQAQQRSLSMAFLLIGILLVLIYRRLRESLFAFIPLVLTAISLLSFLSLSGIHLNFSNAVLGSIVIGAGVDYSIHLLAAIDFHRSGGSGYVSRAIDYASLPILANAIGITIGFSALLLSPLRPHVHVAFIMWITMLVAAVSALVIIPAAYPRDAIHPTSEYVEKNRRLTRRSSSTPDRSSSSDNEAAR